MELQHTIEVIVCIAALALVYIGCGAVVGSFIQSRRRKQTLQNRVDGVRKARGL